MWRHGLDAAQDRARTSAERHGGRLMPIAPNRTERVDTATKVEGAAPGNDRTRLLVSDNQPRSLRAASCASPSMTIRTEVASLGLV